MRLGGELMTFDVNKTIADSISKVAASVEGVTDKIILEKILSKLISGIREGNLQDDDINLLIVQLEEIIMAGE